MHKHIAALLLCALCTLAPPLAHAQTDEEDYDGISHNTINYLELPDGQQMAFRFVAMDTTNITTLPDGRVVGQVHGLFVGTTEVTQRQWNLLSTPLPTFGTDDDLPACGVSFCQILDYINKISEYTRTPLRLPTYREWTYAAAGGEPYPYAGSNNGNLVAWHAANCTAPQPVAQRLPNAYGLYDMCGNANEWIDDTRIVHKNGDTLHIITRIGGSYLDSLPDCRIESTTGPVIPMIHLYRPCTTFPMDASHPWPSDGFRLVYEERIHTVLKNN